MQLLASLLIAGARARRRSIRREKSFGPGPMAPLDRNAKVRVMARARALMRKTEKGKHWGKLTAKFVRVLEALLFAFHNNKTGACFPSYEAIAAEADVCRTTVYEAIHALEAEGVGLLKWVNRIKRVHDWGPDLFGRAQNRVRVIRTSNGYTLVDPQGSSKFKFQTGTTPLGLSAGSCGGRTVLDPENPLHQALLRLGDAIAGRKKAALQ
jgi:biotin operon repressor